MLGDMVLMFPGMMCGADVDARVVFLLDFRYAKVCGGISYDRCMFGESINQVFRVSGQGPQRDGLMSWVGFDHDHISGRLDVLA